MNFEALRIIQYLQCTAYDLKFKLINGVLISNQLLKLEMINEFSNIFIHALKYVISKHMFCYKHTNLIVEHIITASLCVINVLLSVNIEFDQIVHVT